MPRQRFLPVGASVSQDVRLLGKFIGIHGTKTDDKSIWKTDDRKPGVLYKALLYAESVRAVCGKDADTAALYLDFIDTAAFSPDGESLLLYGTVQGNAPEQIPVLENIGCIVFFGFLWQQQGKQTEEAQGQQENGDDNGSRMGVVFFFHKRHLSELAGLVSG